MFFGQEAATRQASVQRGRPTHVFEAAADAGQSVGARRSRVFGSRPGINPCRTVQAVTATPGTPKSDIVPKRETDFTKNVRHIWRSRGTLAKTDRIKPELIARFMAFRPEAGLRLPNGKLRVLRALAAKRKQFVEMRKRHALHCKADEKNGTACECEDIDADLREVLDRRIKDLEQRIKTRLDSHGALAETSPSCGPFPGSGLWPALCRSRRCPSSAGSPESRPPRSRGLRPSRGTADRCAGSG